MTIDEMQAARTALEAEIAALINKFHAATGLQVHRVEVDGANYQRVGERPFYFAHRVIVDARL